MGWKDSGLSVEMGIVNRYLAWKWECLRRGHGVVIDAVRLADPTVLSENLINALLDLVSGWSFEWVGREHLSHDVEDRGVSPKNIGAIVVRGLFGRIFSQTGHPILHLIEILVKGGVKNCAASSCLFVFGGPEAGELTTGTLEKVREKFENNTAQRKDVGLLPRAGHRRQSTRPSKLANPGCTVLGGSRQRS